MAQWCGKFTYNGIRKNGYQIIDMDSNNDRLFGYKKNIETEDSIGDTPLLLGRKKDCETIKVQITKTDGFDNTLPINDEELEELSRWLFKNECGILEVDSHKGVLFYGEFVNGSSWRNPVDKGYITLEFKMASPFGYTRIINNSTMVMNEKNIKITNKTNVDSFVYVDMNIQLYDDTSDVEIENMTTGTHIKFEKLDKDSNIYIYGEGLKQIIDVKNKDNNVIKNTTIRKWIKLGYGENDIKIKSNGRCKVDILFQTPISFY